MRALANSYQEVFSADHPFTMTARYNHARVLGRVGRLDESEHALRAVLADRTKLLGSRHPETLYAQNGLGAVLVERGEFAEAEALLSEVLRAREEILDAAHPHLRDTRELLTRCRQATGN